MASTWQFFNLGQGIAKSSMFWAKASPCCHRAPGIWTIGQWRPQCVWLYSAPPWL